MSIKKYAVVFGVAFLVAGILGMFPAFNPGGYLFGIFQVDWAHNIFHMITGVIALLVAFSASVSRLFFKIFGLVYLFIALLGVLLEGNLVFMQMNAADHILHLVVAAIAIYLGFGKVKKSE